MWDLVGFVLQPKARRLVKIRSNLGSYGIFLHTQTSFFEPEPLLLEPSIFVVKLFRLSWKFFCIELEKFWIFWIDRRNVWLNLYKKTFKILNPNV
ncbi:hypothetical protein Hdeb2414_s0040g00736131 [Helianthus debilis subsp. tardiflorus]